MTGIAEPEYGPEYIHSITDSVKNKQPFTEATREDFEWLSPGSTNVETQNFYFTDIDAGYTGFAQVIHSTIVGIHTTAQFTFKIYNNKTKEQIWTSTKLEDFVIKGNNFYAKNLQIELSEDGTEYHLISRVTEESIVDLTFNRLAPAAKIGKDGKTVYGDNIEEPWGSMRHVFWPRNKVTGEIITSGTTIKINGYSLVIMALQGMKPHHAAASWNFLNFHSKSVSAVVMEFTTPKSYAATKVSLAFIANDEGIIAVSVNNDIVHQKVEIDEIGWPKPNAIEFNLHGVDPKATDEEVASNAKPVEVKVYGDLHLMERVDVMHEIPAFVKNIVSGVAGTKPYIYQYCDDLTIEVGDVKETSIAWVETTFITEL